MQELDKDRIVFDKDVKIAIKKVLGTIAKAVKGTLGPKGTNVGLLDNTHLPMIVNDGATVVSQVNQCFQSDLDKYISKLIYSESRATDREAGDGSSTFITLTEAIVNKGLQLIEAGYSNVDVVKGIKEATKVVLEELENKATPISDELLVKVATISANNDEELGKLIGDAFSKIGVHGQIEVEPSLDETRVEFVEGMQYKSGYMSQSFVNQPDSKVRFENAKILIYEGKLKSIEEIMSVLRTIANNGDSLLIIADDFSETSIQDLSSNKLNAGLKVCAVRSPGYGEVKEWDLEDIALITDTNIASRRFGLEINKVTYEHLGEAKNITVTSDTFSIVVDEKSNIDEKLDELKVKAESLDGNLKREVLDRIARLTSGIAVLYVGGSTPTEITEKHLRIEDAINATRGALEEGILPGGGIALLKVSKSLSDETKSLGYKCLLESLEEPIKVLSRNSSVSGDLNIQEALKGEFEYGYNAKTDSFENLIEAGVIDPKKVTRVTLEKASSFSQMLLTMNCIVY